MLNDIACDLCGSNTYDVVYASTIDEKRGQKDGYACSNDQHGEHYRIVRCQVCGLVFCSPRPDVQEIESGYQEIEDVLYREQAEGRRRTFRRNLKNLATYKNKGQLLDVGCYLGIFLDEAKKSGWDVKGMEPSKWCVEQGIKNFHLDIRQGTYRDIRNFSEKFDVVTMWDVLEHVDSPMKALGIMREALKEDGLLVFSTVDIGSWYARLLGPKWPWLMKMHIYYFDRRCIRQYLEKAGFKLSKIKTYQHVVSLKYLVYKLKRINKILFFAANGIYQILHFFKKEIYITVAMGDFMEVYAQKSSIKQSAK